MHPSATFLNEKNYLNEKKFIENSIVPKCFPGYVKLQCTSGEKAKKKARESAKFRRNRRKVVRRKF